MCMEGNMPYVIDLFSGAGGLSLGASRAGFNVVAAVEIDKHAIKSHALNFPFCHHIQEDILTLTGQDILKESGYSREDIIGVIGGPPCQGFSTIGKQDADDSRNRLFEHFFQIVEDIQPLFFVAENVPGIMNEKYKDIREKAFAHINNYNVIVPFKVKADEYGAPTSRTRYFFIGYKDDPRIRPFTQNDIELMKISVEQRTVAEVALEGLPENITYSKKKSEYKRYINRYWDITIPHKQSDFFYNRVTSLIPPELGNEYYLQKYLRFHTINGCIPTKHSKKIRERYLALSYGQQDRISKSTKLKPDNYCPTLRAGTGPDKGSYQAVRPIHYKYPRVITPREAARLQGFPDWFCLPDTIWHSFRQIGNSVSPIVAERVLLAIFQKLIL